MRANGRNLLTHTPKFCNPSRMGDTSDSTPVAGKSFPWEYIAGYYLRVDCFAPLAEIEGERVGSRFLGAYGIIEAELPNPDVDSGQRIVSLPIEHKSDYKSVYRAHLDSDVKSGENELVVLYEHRRGVFGRRKPCIHVACYPAGTWQGFFDAVDKYASSEFRWPQPLFHYQPSPTRPFPATTRNLFSQSKPDDAVAGTPSLTLLVLALLGLSLYRFWLLGWAALPGNLRLVALVAVCLGVAGVIFGPLWTFGVRSRKKAAVLLAIAAIAFLLLNMW